MLNLWIHARIEMRENLDKGSSALICVNLNIRILLPQLGVSSFLMQNAFLIIKISNL